MSAIPKPITNERYRMIETVAIEAVKSTFFELSRITCVPGKPTIELNPSIHGDISGIINMMGPQLRGTMQLTFPKEAVFYILAQLLQNQITEIDATVESAVGEFTNIVYCQIKAALLNHGMTMNMALPNVILGDQHKVVNASVEPYLVMPFNLVGYTFYVLIQIH